MIDTDEIVLSKEQEEAVARILETDKLVSVLTGPAGTGKSYIIKYLVATGWWTVAATTGKAAMHIGGVTVDTLFCFNRRDYSTWSQSYLERAMMSCANNIIIDEASMIGTKMGDLIYDIAKNYKKRLLLVGDWAQASPVCDGPTLESKLLHEYEFVRLAENHRQDSGPFLAALNKVRLGTVDDEVTALFKSRETGGPPPEEDYIRMFATNNKTNAYNNARLWQHVKESQQVPFRLFARFDDLRMEAARQSRPRNQDFIDKAIDSSPFAHGQTFAIGARVMTTVNAKGGMYVNGDTGVIVGGVTICGRQLAQAAAEYLASKREFTVTGVDVLLDRTQQRVHVGLQQRDIPDALGTAASRVTGVPIALGYACTIHKAQGMTVNRAWFDMPSLRSFPDDESRHGLAYVALSRTRTLDGLRISSWDPSVVSCSAAVSDLL